MKDLLLLHGALGCKKQFDGLKLLLENKYKVHAFNFLGHGGKATNKAFSNKLFSENILQYLNENEIDSCDIFGYSMGGYVALFCAKKHPNKIDKIITLATKFDWTPETAAKEIKMLNPKIIEEKVPKFATMLRARHEPNDWKVVLQNTADMMHGLGNGNALNEDDFKGIKNEVLVAVGNEDKMVSIEESKKVADHLPNGELLVLKGVQHSIEKIDPRILQRVVEKFIL